jgi:hypothetical protein
MRDELSRGVRAGTPEDASGGLHHLARIPAQSGPSAMSIPSAQLRPNASAQRDVYLDQVKEFTSQPPHHDAADDSWVEAIHAGVDRPALRVTLSSLHSTEGAFVMMWVCPICWEVFALQETHCPKCGSDLAQVDSRSFDEKLERALEHPEPQTAQRAAQIIARRGCAGRGIQVLVRALRQRWDEPYVAAAFVRAIAVVDGPHAHDVLLDALGHESLIVRMAAAECLQEHSRVAS